MPRGVEGAPDLAGRRMPAAAIARNDVDIGGEGSTGKKKIDLRASTTAAAACTDVPTCSGADYSRTMTGHSRSNRMAEGTIKRKTNKGFGFIQSATGTDIFFHSSAVEGTTFDQLEEGQRVSYTEGSGPKGPRAEKVRPL